MDQAKFVQTRLVDQPESQARLRSAMTVGYGIRNFLYWYLANEFADVQQSPNNIVSVVGQ